MVSREAAHILAKARSTLVLLAAAETQERVKRLQDRPAPTLIFKTNPNALITRPQLKYHHTASAADP
jgi:hypothetical protein